LAVVIFLFSGMDTFRRPAQADESCEGFVGTDENVLFLSENFCRPEADGS
jgi:hypothetical protein